MGSTRDREGHLAAGDGLRALAALLVLGFHAYIGVTLLLRARGIPFDFGAPGRLLVRGNAGLYVFFVLSGYLVGGPWVRAWLRGGGYPAPLAYVGRRARRIVPAFVVVTLGLVACFGTSGASTGDVVALLAFGQVWLPVERTYVLQQGWTLDVEVMYYLALPLLALLATRVNGLRARLPVLLCALGLVLVLSLAWRAGPPMSLEGAGARHLGTFAWAFVPGLLLAALEPTLRARLSPAAARGLGVALALLGAGSYVALAASDLLDGRLLTLLGYAGTGGGLVGGALLWQWGTGSAPLGLDGRVPRALGRWSYGIYLVHIGVGTELLRHVGSDPDPTWLLVAMVSGMLAGSVLVASALWWLVEQPAVTGRRPALRRGRAHGAETPTGPPATAVPVAE